MRSTIAATLLLGALVLQVAPAEAVFDGFFYYPPNDHGYSQPSDPRPLDMHGCIFFYNSHRYPVQVELPRDYTAVWAFDEDGGHGDRGWLTKNGWEVQVDRTSVLRVKDKTVAGDITLADALGKGATYVAEPKCTHGGWAWIVKY